MANRFRLPGSADLADTAYWSATEFGAGGAAAPTTGDAVYITRGNDALTTGNLNVELASLTIGAGFTGSLGSSGSSITVRCDSGTVLVAGSKAAQINIAGNGSQALAKVQVETAGGAKVRLTAGTVTLVQRNSGVCDVTGNCVVTTFRGREGSSIIEDNATGVTTLVQTGTGHTVCRRDVTTCITDESARVEIDRDAAVTTAQIGGTAVLNYHSSGTLGTLNQYGGVFDPSNAVVNVTVTTANRYGGRYYSKVGGISAVPGSDPDVSNLGTLTAIAPLSSSLSRNI